MDKNSHPSTLKRRLYAMLKEGNCTDVDLLVTTSTDEIRRVPAHKNILVAMSSVIATKMTQRWEEGGQGKDVIEIPSGFCVESVEKFLEFLYTEELQQDLNVELLLELIYLADHYNVEELMALCDENLIEKLEVENCIQIYENCRFFPAVKCGKISFNLIKKNFGRIVTLVPKDLIQMNAITWKTILELNYLPNVEEIELFKGLKRWKDENVEERASDFKELIKLIRFPLVGVKNFEEFVVPSGELDGKFVIQMVENFDDKEKVLEQFKNCVPRNLLEPKNSAELQTFIDESQNGDIIELNGIYSGFGIPGNKTNLTIRGKKGGEAVINATSFGIIIEGQRCKIEGISIKTHFSNSVGVGVGNMARGNVLENITITGGLQGIYIFGNENSFSNITLNDPKEMGFYLWGQGPCEVQI